MEGTESRTESRGLEIKSECFQHEEKVEVGNVTKADEAENVKNVFIKLPKERLRMLQHNLSQTETLCLLSISVAILISF